MVCPVYQEPDAATLIAVPIAEIRIAVIQIVALPNVALPNAAIRIVAIPNAATQSAVRVGIRVALIVGLAPLARDVRGVEFHAAVPKPA